MPSKSKPNGHFTGDGPGAVGVVFADDIDPTVALAICTMAARALIARDDEDGEVPAREQEIFVAMLAEVFDYEATNTYLEQHKQGPIVEWMTRFPEALESMLQRLVRRSSGF